MSNVAERVKKIVVEHLGVEEAKVTDKASFIDDLGADSLDNVELVMAFEEEFGVESRTMPLKKFRPSRTLSPSSKLPKLPSKFGVPGRVNLSLRIG